MTANYEVPVLIVGAGPVGLALAGDLGWRGMSCIVVEQSDGSIYQPRQDFVGVRTMEFCRRWGIVGDVEASPYPRDYPQDNIYIAGSLAEGWEIGRWPSASMNDTKPPPQSPQHRERCPQNMFDPILRKFAGSFESVDIRYQHRLIGCRDEGETVLAKIENVVSGRRCEIQARWLVGCDGASSAVRAQMDVPMEGNAALTYTTNVIFRCADFGALHPIPPGYRFIFIGPEGTWATIVAINGRDEWRFSIIRSGDKPGAPEASEIHALIRRAVGREFDYDILSVVPWTRRELVAAQYDRGHLLIAGDAAHVTSPTGGFGMNMGVGDAVDLSWKLTALEEGWGGEQLIASYTAERRLVAIRTVREASGNLARMLSPGNNPTLLDRTPEGEALRAQVGGDLAQAMMREWNTLGIHLGYFYDNSPLIIADGTPPPSLDPGIYEQPARPGSRAPHHWLADGRSTIDLFGRGFVLTVFDTTDPKPLIDAAADRGLPLTVEKIKEPSVAEAYGRNLVLVRPDGHVAWRGDDAPGDAGTLIDRIRGAA